MAAKCYLYSSESFKATLSPDVRIGGGINESTTATNFKKKNKNPSAASDAFHICNQIVLQQMCKGQLSQ